MRTAGCGSIIQRLSNRDEKGAVILIATLGAVLALIAGALAVDLGFLAHEARLDQKVADLAALDAVRLLPGDPTGGAIKSASRNKFDPATNVSDVLTVEPGILATTGTFLPVPAALSSTANAVRVSAQSVVKYQFVDGSKVVRRAAIATTGNGTGCFAPEVCVKTPTTVPPSGVTTTTGGPTTTVVGPTTTTIPGGGTTYAPLGTVRVGSKVASLNSSDSVILNRLLTQVVGGTYTLDAIGYQGLVNGDVQFSKLRTALGVGLGQVDQLGSATFSFRQILDATVTALNQQGDSSSTVAAAKLATIATQVTAAAGLHFSLLNLLNAAGNVGSGKDIADATVNVMDIVRAGLVLADNDHFAQFDLLASSNDLPLLQTLLPNFVSARVKLGLIEAPQTKSGPDKQASGSYQTIASTSQVRLMVTVTLQVNVLGVGIFNVDVPYYISAGSAQAKLDTLQCAAGQAVPTRVDILGVTQAGSASIGTVTDPNLSNAAATPTPGVATLTDVNLAGLTHVTINTTSVVSTTVAGQSQMLSFSPPYTSSGASQPVPGTQLLSVPVLGGSNLSVNVTVLGLVNVGLQSSVTTAVVSAVTSAATPVINTLLTPLMRSLGLSLAGADVWAPPVQTCSPTSFNTVAGGNVPYMHPVLVH